jgi:hypothetical protein
VRDRAVGLSGSVRPGAELHSTQKANVANVAQRAALLRSGPLFPLPDSPKATQEAAEAVLAAYLEGRREEQEDVFDWHRDDSIALERQLSIAIYLNPRDHLVIRQEREADQDEDTFIYIAPQNIAAFIDHLCRVAGIPRGKRS